MAEWMMYNPSPSGRSVGDCAVRAVAKALDTDWETAYALITLMGYQLNDMPSSNAVWGALLRQKGFKRYALPNECPNCYTVEEFADDHPEGTFVVGTGNHVVTIVDNTVFDSWDSRKEIAVYFWAKEPIDGV